MGLIPGSGRPSGKGNGNPLQYSCLGSSTDRGAWRATVHGVKKSRTRLSDWTTTGASRQQGPRAGSPRQTWGKVRQETGTLWKVRTPEASVRKSASNTPARTAIPSLSWHCNSNRLKSCTYSISFSTGVIRIKMIIYPQSVYFLSDTRAHTLQYVSKEGQWDRDEPDPALQ